MGKLSSKSLTQNPENRQNLGLQNIEDPAKNFGQDPDLPNPARSGFTFRTDRTPTRGFKFSLRRLGAEIPPSFASSNLEKAERQR